MAMLHGTTSPEAALHIYGASGATGEIKLQSSDGKTYVIGSTGSTYGSTNNFIIYDIEASAERMRITADGNVGIGTTSPTTNLSLGQNVLNTKPSIAAYDDGTNYYGIGTVNSPEWGLGLWAGGSTTPRMIVNLNGNVGIGTTSPVDTLHVKGTERIEDPSSDKQINLMLLPEVSKPVQCT
jgi:hypothetical protein